MFIIHGHYVRARQNGVVADHCRHCNEVTQLQLIQYYKVQHVYFIPMGSGSLVNSELTCTDCGMQSYTSPHDYLGIVSPKRAPSLSLGEVLDETNPRLAKLLAAIAELRKGGEASTNESAAHKELVQDVCKKLWQLGPHHPAQGNWLPRLNEWSQLNRAAQTDLLREVGALHEETAQRVSRQRFIQTVAKHFKTDVDALLSRLALLLVSIGGIVASVVLMSDITLRWVGSLTSLVAGFVSLALVQRWQRRRAHRKFFQTILLPKATSQNIDLARFMEEVRGYQSSGTELDKKIRAMARALPMLEEMVREMGLPVEPPPSSEPSGESSEHPEDPMLFLLAIGKSFKPKSDDLVPVLAGVTIAGLLFAAGVIWLEKVAILPKLLLVLLGGGISFLWVYRWLERRRHLRFFRHTLLPEARRRGVKLSEVVEVLAAIRAKDSDVEHPLHSLSRSWHVLNAMASDEA